MSHVFISYARQNKSIAFDLKEKLEKEGKDTWVDLEDIPPSRDWWDEIKRAIVEADAIVYLVSLASLASKNCQNEIETAKKYNKRLFLILAPETSIKDLPESLAKIQVTQWEDIEIERGFKKFLNDLDTDHDWVKFHTDLVTKSYLWNEKKDSSHLLRGKVLKEAEKQLAQTQNKKPEVLDLQRDFVAVSRKREVLFRGSVFVISVIVILVLAFLTNFAKDQQGNATNSAATAQALATNESLLQAEKDKEEANAEEQKRIALARKLATDAKNIFSLEVDNQILSGLLAVESMKLYPNSEALEVLRSITLVRPVSTIKIVEEDDWVTTLSFSPDEETKYLVGGTRLGAIRVWETSIGKEIFSAAATSEINKLDFNGQYIVAGDYEGKIYVWDVLNKNLNFIIERGEANIVGLQFAQYGKYIVSVENGNNIVEINVWDVETGDGISSISYSAALQAYAISSDGKLIALSTYECELYEINSNVCKESDVLLFELESGREVTSLRHPRYVESMVFTSFYDTLITGSSDGNNGFVSIWSDPWSEPAQILLPNVYSSVNVAGSPNGLKIAASDSDENITHIFASGKEISRFPLSGTVAFSGDSQYLTIDSFNNFVVVEAGTGEEVARIKFDSGHPVVATNLRNFYRKNNLIATSDCDENKVCYIQLWSFGNGSEVWLSQPKNDIVTEICLRLPRSLTQDEWDKYVGDTLRYEEEICSNK